MLRRTRRTLLVLLAVAAIAAVGCSDSDDEPTATPDDGGAAGTIPAAVGPGISVAEALSSTLDGPLLVNGFLVITPEGARLCEALAESFPPQCGGDSLLIEADDPTTLAELESEGDVSWTADSIQLLGEVDGETLRVSELTSG